ncbi:unnamed protein product [Chrysoparadoxa australica]
MVKGNLLGLLLLGAAQAFVFSPTLPRRNTVLSAPLFSSAASSNGNMERMEVTLHNDGRVSIKMLGVKGEQCRDITEDMIKELGDVIYTENTEEFYEQPVEDKAQVLNTNKPTW